MYAAHRGGERLRTEIAGPTVDSTSEGRGVPVLDAAVSRSADRQKIVLKLVNTDLTQDLNRSLSDNCVSSFLR